MCGSHSHGTFNKLVNMAQQVEYACAYCGALFETYDLCGDHTIDVHAGFWPLRHRE
ncbi:hypothetical protein IW139_001129 [Coemansia sp. RSA 353]|nr:hypothetical protein IW142_002862 [Coemansia sp. RSA 564]KAJ2199106.1 hypothetical protein GGH18_000705 [Coemansia sp. RSA 530]KAJ2224867.1 hypothetical protein IW143_000332 [Coemansia sp. RSA 520]KAJ2300359.1 hypothetical protein IW139_001129 [Coemansia sp. RSA 353]KAJ2436076.1 hypothetical protein IWW41_000465 [Coemansia sp. RSA 2522]KAJ2551716.1 hypothetical protein IWW35_002673 [Coemansia sp. RSA 1878]KAJ2585985.1 hypothetical protein IWW49_004276 [Coemansia sp. RSA 1797]